MTDNDDIDMQTFQLDINEETKPNIQQKPQAVKYKEKKSSNPSQTMIIMKGIALGVIITFALIFLLSLIQK
jgi:hypothetical protein